MAYDIPRTSDNCALALELNKPLEDIYTDVAIQGDSALALDVPATRYVCMVKSFFNGNLCHLDSKQDRPGNLGLSTEHVLSDKCLNHVNRIEENTIGKGQVVTMLALVSG
jgi:hypothetical protein